ncbi:putative NmrA-like domain-containing protein [Seiridium cardinale]|uniref:NmrA-like domain-containing protein n=1 Tax=Seiridium cardinale TaxID=138064 RepID=A0ABR2YAE6_9PEZI
MSTIENVTLVGGSGHLGTFVLKKLIASRKFNVRVIKRVGSESSYAAGAEVVEVEFSSLESLKAGFKDQDAVICLINDSAIPGQKLMIDAAIAAGVKRFLPSNFGSNMANPSTRKIPIFTHKIAVEEYLIEKSKTSALTYTFVYNGPFLDFCLQHNVLLDLSKYQPAVFDGGDTTFSSTTMPTVGDAVVGVLTHPAETQNRGVYVSELVISQNLVLSLAKQIAPNKPWEPVHVKLGELVAGSKEKLAQGHFDLATVVPFLVQSMVDPDFGGRRPSKQAVSKIQSQIPDQIPASTQKYTGEIKSAGVTIVEDVAAFADEHQVGRISEPVSAASATKNFGPARDAAIASSCALVSLATNHRPQPDPASAKFSPEQSSSTNMSSARLFIASLGNPSPYQASRHSAGHVLLKALQSHLRFPPLKKSKLYANGYVSLGADVRRPEYTLWQSPSYMNVSGTDLLRAYRQFVIETTGSAPENGSDLPGLVVLHDEMESGPGQLRPRSGNSSAKGHNGIKSVQRSLQSAGLMTKLTDSGSGGKFIKVGIGIRRPQGGSRDKEDVSAYLLDNFGSTEFKKLVGSAPSLFEILEDAKLRMN